MGDEAQGKKSKLQEREKFKRREIGMEKKGLSVMLIVALLATSFLQLHARVDLFTAFTAGVDSGKGGPCCDQCFCALSEPPQCQCFDVKCYCHPSCKSCICTKSIPPQCRCLDIKDHCDKPCKATGFVN